VQGCRLERRCRLFVAARAPVGHRADSSCRRAIRQWSRPRLSYDAAVPDEPAFDDVLAANESYARGFHGAGLQARAARGLAVLTCIDSRIEPLEMLGLRPGDAKILRNAGARVTSDVLRTLVLASYLLDVDRLMVIGHTDCRMAAGSEDDVHTAVLEAGGPDTRSLTFLVTSDLEATVRADVQRVQSWPYLTRLRVGGFLYDVGTGRVTQLC
jgi:carbonic anhydrase